MRALFGGRRGVTVAVSPAAVRPRGTVQAVVTVARPIDKVIAARIELGYHNFYRYRWAGRVDAAAAQGADTMWLLGEVGTNYGSDRDTADWVGVLDAELPVVDGEFRGGTAAVRVPSWAPGSSPLIAQWACRLVVERGGRDVCEDGLFSVVIAEQDATVAESGPERVAGEGAAELDIALSAPIYRSGQDIGGQLTITPGRDLPDGDAAVCWQRHRYSHPTERTPGPGGALDGPVLHLGKHLPLRAGEPIRLPFTLPLPPDAAPSALAVHSSLGWFVAARLFYSGFKAPLTERVRRPIVVVNTS